MIPAVIALCGPAGSGKSTVANYLAERYGAQRHGFALPLKQMVKRALDFTDEQVFGTQEQKEAVDPRYGHSPRWFLQRVGTEGCRAVFGEDFWTKQCVDAIARQAQPLAVIEDMRFVNEGELVQLSPKINGYIWRLWPVGDDIALARAEAAGKHASEEEWKHITADLELAPGTRGVEQLYALVDEAVKTLPGQPESGVRW
jgi:hypothetical protein